MRLPTRRVSAGLVVHGRWLAGLLLLLLAAAQSWAAPADARGEPAVVPEIALDGAVGPASAGFVVDAIHQAETRGAPFVILRIDTPGGLSTATRDIVQAVLGASIPIVGYVAPAGARAASAGTYILMATHVAAMAPATTLGAATPVNLGPGASEKTPPTDRKNSDSKTDTPDLSQAPTKRRKQVNDAVAYIRALAERRGRNADWAEAAVRDAATLTAAAAKNQDVVELIADTTPALLAALDGRRVDTAAGAQTLATQNVQVRAVTPDWRTRILAAITDPTVAYLLFMIGLVGLAAEALNPGAAVPGVIGAISLLTALYAFNMMPIDLTGAALIALGVALTVAEAFVPSFGVLGLGGVVALLFGSLMLTDTPGYDVSTTVILTIAIGGLLIVATAAWQFRRARQTRTQTGYEGMLGARCAARHDFEHAGRVWLHGESWRATTDRPVVEGQTLEVVSVSGLTVHVRPVADTPPVSSN